MNAAFIIQSSDLTMQRYLCIHCHFYQPPRENPWLEAVEVQDSASPYHDWNQRITAECYAPNAAARMLDSDAFITRIVNNYEKISFNFGPTLLSWMQEQQPETYAAILEADRRSRLRFSGHGSALAQAYNHMILPLATCRDKHTQVLWGIRDFEHRFQRPPEGMWLPETAVDTETLEVLAEQGIRFTILAPRQAARVRKIGGRRWKDLHSSGIDPSRAYLCRLPSGGTINLFFYDGPISQAVAFEKLLDSGEKFAARLLSGFSDRRDWPQLMHIATDGETYGHHHAHGDMALAYALDKIESSDSAVLTNYGEFLEKHPATHEVQVAQNTSWSCSHGVQRWRADCGCNSGRAGWNQAWRGPLRNALDFLRDQLATLYQERASALLRDPWRARDAYINVVLDRSPQSIDQFLRQHALSDQNEQNGIEILKLLEMQRHLLLMYTSCGWFFDEVSGIETVQVLQYAGRAVQLAQALFDVPNLEPRFLELLSLAESNLPEHANAAQIYNKSVKPAAVNLQKVVAHYGISCMFVPCALNSRIFCYKVARRQYRTLQSGPASLALGEARVRSTITRESAVLFFCVLHLGNQHVQAGVRPLAEGEPLEQAAAELAVSFESGDMPQVMQLLEQHFASRYSLQSLFRDQQRAILDRILQTTLQESEAGYRRIYEQHAPLMRFVTEMGVPQPPVFYRTAEFVLNVQLRQALAANDPDLLRVSMLLQSVQSDGVAFDAGPISYAMRNALQRMMRRVQAKPGEIAPIQKINAALDLAGLLPFAIDLWQTQNIYYALMERKPLPEEEAHHQWHELFMQLGQKLKIHFSFRASHPEEEIPDTLQAA